MTLGRVLSQKFWPTAGDVDDCWCLAGIQAAAAVVPWSYLPNVTAFRAAAGRPDVQGVPNGGTELDIAAGIRGTFPAIAPLLTVVSGESWAKFSARIKAGRVAAVIVLSAKLPASFGFAGVHAVSIDYDGASVGFRIANPLAPPHSSPAVITEAALEAAMLGYKGACYGVVMPSAEAAFTTHPLYLGALLEGRRQEYDANVHAIGARP